MGFNVGSIIAESKMIQESVAKTAKFVVKGSPSAREALSRSLMMNFTEDIVKESALTDKISANKLYELYEKRFPGIKIELGYNVDKTCHGSVGINSNIFNKSARSYTVSLPFERINGETILKLNKKNADTLFHETNHLADLCYNPKYIATDCEVDRTIARKFEKVATEQNLSTEEKAAFKEIADKFNEGKKELRNAFYSNEIRNFKEFKAAYKKGGLDKEQAVAKRINEITEGTNILDEPLREFNFGVPTYKFVLNSMIMENNAFMAGELYRKQYQMSNVLINATLRKLGTIDLEMLNTPEAGKIMQEFLQNADRNRIMEQVAKKIEEKNNIHFFFPEKIKFLRQKLAEEIKYRRAELKLEREGKELATA